MEARLLKINLVLLLLVLLTFIFYFGRVILIPLISAALLAMLMAPLCNKLDKKGFKRSLSCLVCIAILLIIFIGVMAILMAQLSGIIQDLPLFQQKINAAFLSVQQHIENRFDIPADQQTEILKRETEQISQSFGKYITNVLQSSLFLLVSIIITLFLRF